MKEDLSLSVECRPMHARLTARGCKTNREIAMLAFEQMTQGHIWKISATHLNRLFHCGACPNNPDPIPPDLVLCLIQADVDHWITLLDRYASEYKSDGGGELQFDEGYELYLDKEWRKLIDEEF